MVGGVGDGGVGLRQLPDRSFHAAFSRCVHLADGAMLLSVRVRQAELDRQWLQSGVLPQEQQSSGGIYFDGESVDAVEVGEVCIMMIQDEELVLLQCLQEGGKEHDEARLLRYRYKHHIR